MENFVKQLTVDKSIVPLLSKSVYQRSFPYAIREVVSNSYDADATVVHIKIDDRKKEILIEDNGNGMTLEEFDFYLRIAGKRRGKTESPKFGRKRVGQFGIGFLAIFPFCESLEITSTAENSELIFTANIPASKFFKETSKTESLNEVDVKGYSFEDTNKIGDHFTRIRLIGLSDGARKYLSSGLERLINKGSRGKVDRSSIKNWSGIDRFKWELEDDLPLTFPDNSELNDILKYQEPYGMEVYLQGEKLFRNDPKGEILDSGEINGERISFRYAIVTNWKSIKPYEMRGIKIRVRNVGIGQRNDFGVQTTRRYSRFHWITGEVQILDGLDESLTLSRDSFIFTPEYEELTERVSKLLRKNADYIEYVDIAARDMTKHVRGGKQKSIGAKKEVLEKNLRALVEKGFTVHREQTDGDEIEPIKVDRKKKEVIVYEGHPSLEDTIRLGKRKIPITYDSWDYSDAEKFPACRIENDGQIVINTKYPLFKTKRYGEIFMKINVIILLARKECSTPSQMYEYVIEKLSNEFEDYK